FEFKTLIASQLEFRHHLEHRAKLHRLAFIEVQLLHFRLRNRREFLLRQGLFHALRHKRLQHFALNVVRESAANQRNGRLPAPESRNRGQARELFRHALDLFRHFFGGNLQFQLAAAACLSHGGPFRATSLSLLRDLRWSRWRRRTAPTQFQCTPVTKRILTFGRGQTGEGSPCNLNHQYRRDITPGQTSRCCSSYDAYPHFKAIHEGRSDHGKGATQLARCTAMILELSLVGFLSPLARKFDIYP